jgi:wyosine [tRNA(Phe)-imidazoG37] synthetase (radical SAM superfamily)
MIAFGPIPSRRLGKSLGINNIASQKACSYNCIYCQIGNTLRQSMVRQVFYDPESLVNDIEKHLKKLDKENAPDYLTFVANGEPTLDINLGREIRLLKKFNIPIAVITNSSLIYHPQVQEDLNEADWVSVKVDSVLETVWKKINQPLTSIDLENVLHGLKDFSAVYKGKLHTETMLLEGYNDSIIHMSQTASFIASLNPLKAYLSVPTRPPALKSIKAVSEERILEVWQIFQKMGITTELLTGFEGTGAGTTGNAIEDILNITAVHPLREDTMAALLKHDKTDDSVINSLIAQGLIKGMNHNGKTFYVRSYHFK